MVHESRGSHPDVTHYHDLLVQQHRHVGGTVLEGYGLRVRTFETRPDRRTQITWGADYWPLWPAVELVLRISSYRGQVDPELGLVAPIPNAAWLTIGEQTRRRTKITKFAYNVGAWRLPLDHTIAVSHENLSMPLDQVAPGALRGGLSGDYTEISKASTEERMLLVTTMQQLLAAQVIGDSEPNHV